MGLCVGLGVGFGVGFCVGRCDGRSVGDRVGVGGLVGLGVVGLRGNAAFDSSLTTITTGSLLFVGMKILLLFRPEKKELK